jgi:hypothetical protein
MLHQASHIHLLDPLQVQNDYLVLGAVFSMIATGTHDATIMISKRWVPLNNSETTAKRR